MCSESSAGVSGTRGSCISGMAVVWGVAIGVIGYLLLRCLPQRPQAEVLEALEEKSAFVLA